ncbi:MAG: ATP-binding protein [Candidatus Dependentiae bacterium]|nr:ATP-binding protein [Candidatus Dependentiae bacterium]
MIARKVAQKIALLRTQFPIIALIGPRQSGKSTLSKMLFPSYTYISLEDPDTRMFAETDARGFLAKYTAGEGVIFDEIQRVPQLLSYLQGIVDAEPRQGFFVLTGSQNFLLHSAITQTLAGRVAICSLLPFSVEELHTAHLDNAPLDQTLFRGMYPRLFDLGRNPADWYQSYIATYVERDVRLIQQIQDLDQFQRFLALCAGRIGQLLNLSSLANDAGISVNTAKAWLSLLGTSFITFTIHPHFKNFSKRLIKAPKLYFYDTGLACALLRITSPEQLSMHYLRGGLFESFVVSELQKYFFNRGARPPLYFWRDKTGHEIDVIIEYAGGLLPVKIKSGSTINASYFDELKYWNKLSETDQKQNIVLYGGSDEQRRSTGHILSWRSLATPDDWLHV